MSDPTRPEGQPERPEAAEPKIVVDDDWKEQVAREKEQALHGKSDQPPGERADDEPAAPEAPSADFPAGDPGAPPPATFEILVSMLYTQAMSLLGQMPDPTSGEAQVNKPFAKHTIDTLEMLEEKTRGNLNEDEAKILSEALHDLRLTYVNVKA